VLEGTKDGIAIKVEPIDDGLSTKLALVVCIASVKLVGQLRTIVRMRMGGSPDRITIRCIALISLDAVASVNAQLT
jgi:hypothetical protein